MNTVRISETPKVPVGFVLIEYSNGDPPMVLRRKDVLLPPGEYQNQVQEPTPIRLP